MRAHGAMIVAFVLIVAGSGVGAVTGAKAQPHRPPAPWSVVDQRLITVDGDPMALSPNGRWLAGPGPDDDFCVWDVETLDPACDGQLPSIIPRSIAWAPDSMAVAFSVDTPTILRDSDVLVFEVETGTLVNLTDDDPGDEDFATLELDREAADPVPVDLFPTWSPDSDDLVFARTIWGAGTMGTTLMTIPRTGGEPVELRDLRPRMPFLIFSPMAWLDDGAILFSHLSVDAEDSANGIWRLPASGDPELIIPGSDADEIVLPSIADVSADEDLISVVSFLGLNAYGADIETVYFLVDVGSGETTPVAELAGTAASPEEPARTNGPGRLTAPARFSPDGDTMITWSWRGDGTHLLAVVDTDGRVYDLDIGDALAGKEVPSRRSVEMGIDWATNDTVFMELDGPDSQDGGLLLTLEPREDTADATPAP